MLICRAVTVHYGGVRALDGVDLRVAAGERVAIIGPNGSGKSTLINVCSGLTAPTAGTIFLYGAAVTTHSPEAFARAGVGRTFQNLRLMEELSIFDNVALGLNSRLRTVAGIPVASRRRVRREVAAACAQAGLDMASWRPVADLSYGQRKRVELARVLIGRTSLLLLDEPAAGLSRVDTPALARVLRGLGGPGRAMILVEHDLDLIAAVASRVVCVDRGRVIADGEPGDVLDDPQVRLAVLGRASR
jgi:ABC-type branched-subunit amino acid transport system ATPase component